MFEFQQLPLLQGQLVRQVIQPEAEFMDMSKNNGEKLTVLCILCIPIFVQQAVNLYKISLKTSNVRIEFFSNFS